MKAIIVVSFGSSIKQARLSLEKIEKYIMKGYPDRDFFSSYTSGFIRKKLAAQGEAILSPEEILKDLHASGYKDVLILPTHIIPGQEYEKLSELTLDWQDKFEVLSLGAPLIQDAKDLQKVSDVVSILYPVEEDEAIIFMGHGTSHISNFIYPAIQTAFRTSGKNNMYMATVEGWPTLDDAVKQIKATGITKIYLAPFLLIAGDHVLNDMVGENEDSWLNQLKKQGFSVRYCSKGLGEFEEVLDLYIN